jgi:hypothetical protein
LILPVILSEIACLHQLTLEQAPPRGKVLSVKNKVLGTALTLLIVASAIGQAAPARPPGGISGVVRLPDGTPSEGATVTAITDCKEMGYNLVQEAKTSTSGSFYFSPFVAATCNRVRLSATKVEDLWLKTGHEVFYGGDNGTTPVVENSSSGPPTTTEIVFGNRGASVSFRVRDAATDRFIWAELYIKRVPVPGKEFGSIQIATGRDGSPDTLLLPAGQYEVFVEQYSCDEADYFALNPTPETFAVDAGQRLAKDISVDVRLIKPAKSYANPSGRPCKP